MSLPRLPADPTPEELTTRFLLQRSHFSAERVRVKPRTFEPARRDHKTSIFRIQALSERRIWALGQKFVGDLHEKDVLARADISVAQIASAGLTVEAAEPPPRHANIAGWPTEKDAWKSQAQELAALATLRMRNAQMAAQKREKGTFCFFLAR